MAFPTTSVLTSFTGTDEDPLSEGGNWSGPMVVARGRHMRNTNQMRPNATGSATKQSYWTPATFTETEVFATIANKAVVNGQYFDLCARIVAPNTAGVDMYQLDISLAAGADVWAIYRIINASGTLVDTMTATEVAVGDQVGLEVTGTGATVTLNAYHKPSAGSWTLVDTFADTDANRITSAGYIGVESTTTVWYFDDFGGGEIVSAVETQSFYASRRRSWR